MSSPRKSYTTWRKLNRNLTEFMQAHELFNEAGKEVHVQSGATAQKPKDFPTVYVLRAQERGIDLHTNNTGKTYMWLEFWVRNDNPDPSAAYDELELLEDAALNILLDWVPTLPSTLNMAAHLRIPEWKGDGDTIRPTIVSRMTLEIEWKRSGYR